MERFPDETVTQFAQRMEKGEESLERIEVLEQALRSIITHQELIGGSMGKQSTVYLIATKALTGGDAS
jgi:hypothetical protein